MATASDQEAIDAVAGRFHRGDLAGARADCGRFLAAVDDLARRAPFHYWQGAIELRGGDLPAAIEQFELALRSDRHNPQVLQQLGAANLQSGDFVRAETCYREAIRHNPRLPVAHYNLGIVLQQKKDLHGAQRAFESALAHRPAFPEALNNLANTLAAQGNDNRAGPCYQQALAIDPGFANAHHGLGLWHRRWNRHDEAIHSFEAAVRHRPRFVEAWLDLAEARFTDGDALRALACIDEVLKHDAENETARFKRSQYAGEQPAQIPNGVIEHLYAGFASTFDDHLVQHLNYRVPALLVEELQPWIEGLRARRGHGPAVLDLGCGTGLFGVAARPHATTLVGVDLSTEMLAKAAERHIYDKLAKGDLVAYLQEKARADGADKGHTFDLIAACDVLIYLGNLDRLFECVAACLPVDGLFVFSVESLHGADADYLLKPTGRYGHQLDYIQRLAGAVGLERVRLVESTIRTEGGTPIRGYLAILKKS